MSSNTDEHINDFAQEQGFLDTTEEKTSTIGGIYKAFKDVHEASRQTSQAERELKNLEAQIKLDSETLEHRREIEAHYSDIIAEQTAIVEEGVSSQGKILDITEQNTAKKTELTRYYNQVVEQNKNSIEPLRTASDEAQQALDDAARQLAICKRTEQASRQQLDTLISQRNKQTKSLNASILASKEAIQKLRDESTRPNPDFTSRDKLDLREKITIEQNRLGEYEQNLHRIERDAQKNIEAAQQAIETEQRRLEGAKLRHDEIRKDAEYRLKRLEELSEKHRLEEEELQSRINDVDAYQSTLEDHGKEIEQAIESARELMREAEDIHNNPEVTQQLALSIMRNETKIEELEIKHAELQAYEDELRSSTRTQRISTIAGVAVVVLLIVFVILAYYMGWFS